VGATLDGTLDEACPLQHPDVFRGGGERNGERRGEPADRPLAVGERAQHLPAGTVAEGVEDGVEPDGFMFNHVVEYARLRLESQLMS
jgi:hypothetical protein